MESYIFHPTNITGDFVPTLGWMNLFFKEKMGHLRIFKLKCQGPGLLMVNIQTSKIHPENDELKKDTMLPTKKYCMVYLFLFPKHLFFLK